MPQVEPLQYQIEDMGCIESHDGVILNALEMGLGKTYETLWAFKRNPHWLPALIVTPGSVKYNWQWEASHFWNMPASVCEGRTPPKRNQFDFLKRAPLTIINYEILQHWLPYLKGIGFNSIVCDECQELQNMKTRRTRATREMAESVPRVQMLSGTPFSNRPSELFPALNMLWPDIFPSFYLYGRAYCKPRNTPWGVKYDGAENLDVLRDILKEAGMVRHRWADIAHEIPPKERQIIPCELSDPGEYSRASNDFIRWLRGHAAHRVRAAERAESLTRITTLLQLTAQLKLKSCVDWANQFLAETDDKLFLGAIHQGAIDVMQRRVSGKSVTIDGSLTHRQKFAAVQQFHADDSVRTVIGSRTSWKGINLTPASTAAAVELFWRPGDMLQFEGRVYRIGQKKVSKIVYFVAAGTIEERICEILQKKQETISAVLDGGSQDGDLNILDLFLGELKQRL